MKFRIGFLPLVVLLCLVISGCWDTRDVNDIAFAVGMGIDHSDDSSTGSYTVTLEFAEPDPGKPSPRSFVLSADGDSVSHAIQRVQTQVSREISLSHLRVLLIGEDLAKQRDFRDLSNYLMKDPEVALRLRLFFVQGDEAQTLRKVTSQFGQLLSAVLVSMGQGHGDISTVRTNHFYNFWSDLHTNNGTALGSRLYLSDDGKSIIREGGVAYKNWRLDGWLDAKETQAANWLLQDTRAIVVAKEGRNSYTYQVSSQKAEINVQPVIGELGFVVRVVTNGLVMEETGGNLDFSKGENLQKAETLIGKTIKGQIQSAINKSQREIEADYLGFGKALQQQQPKTFDSLDWPAVFPGVPISVEVESKVSGSALQS